MDGARYLEDGRVTIFKRSGIFDQACVLQVRLNIFGDHCGHTNEQTAIQLGRRLLFQIEQRVEQGLPPKSKSFAEVIDDYIRYRERDHAHGKTSAEMPRQVVRVSRFWREYEEA